jgi:2-polyprenyl-6-methoxyphenol hydroxylase-like FAD-dependent oxidoreductase
MTEEVYDVVQVGMGPCGLTLGALIGQSGHTVAMVERHEGLYGLPRAGHIDHEIVRILQSLDCHEPVMADSYPTLEYVWVNADGETLMEFDWGAEGISGWHSDYMQYQPVLEGSLVDRIKRDARIDSFSGWEAVAIREHDDYVELEIRRTRRIPGEARPVVTEEVRTLRGRYLVGADGANSFVRCWLGAAREDLGFNERWLDVDARKKRDLRFDFDCGQRCDPRRPTTILPLGKRHRRWEWALLPGETIEEFERPETAWRLLGELGVTRDDVEIVRQLVYTFEARLAHGWRRGRVFLLGDACHTMPPFMGQGMCSGMRDAKNLAWKLDLVLRGIARDALLDSYQQERLPHVRDWTVISLEAGKVPCTTDPVAARARDERFRAGWRPPMPDFPQLTCGVLARLGGLARSPAGELGLQARVGRNGQIGLFDDLFAAGARWQVISTAGDPRRELTDSQLQFLKQLGTVFAHVGSEGGDAIDVDGRYAAYCAEREIEVVINRPDFYVYGGAPSLSQLPALVAELEFGLTGIGARSSTELRKSNDHAGEPALATTHIGASGS